MADQLCFSFDGGEPRAVSGVEIWRERRRAELDRFAAETGLPIGHLVRLRIGKVDFLAAEVESCVRLDSSREVPSPTVC